MNNKAVSLIEILVSCVIIALLVGGLSSVFVAGSRWIMDIHAQTAAEEIGKLFLDPMQMHVRQGPTNAGGDQWNGAGNALLLGTTYCDGDAGHIQNPLCPSVITNAMRKVGKIDYGAEYNIQDFNNVRKVKAVITWVEPEAL